MMTYRITIAPRSTMSTLRCISAILIHRKRIHEIRSILRLLRFPNQLLSSTNMTYNSNHRLHKHRILITSCTTVPICVSIQSFTSRRSTLLRLTNQTSRITSKFRNIMMSLPLLVGLRNFLGALRRNLTILNNFSSLLNKISSTLHRIHEIQSSPLNMYTTTYTSRTRARRGSFLFRTQVSYIVRSVRPGANVATLSTSPGPTIQFTLPLRG